MTGDKVMIQKLLDYDCILQQKLKSEECAKKPSVKPEPKSDGKTSIIIKDGKLKGKVPVPSKIASVMGSTTKQEKLLELNTSFERDYTNTAEFSQSETLYINFKDYEGCTALPAAVIKGNYDAAKILLYNGASLFVRDRKLQASFSCGAFTKIANQNRDHMIQQPICTSKICFEAK